MIPFIVLVIVSLTGIGYVLWNLKNTIPQEELEEEEVDILHLMPDNIKAQNMPDDKQQDDDAGTLSLKTNPAKEEEGAKQEESLDDLVQKLQKQTSKENAEIDELKEKYEQLENLLNEKNQALSQYEESLRIETQNREDFEKVKEILQNELWDTKQKAKEAQSRLTTHDKESERYKEKIFDLEQRADDLEKLLAQKEKESLTLTEKIEEQQGSPAEIKTEDALPQEEPPQDTESKEISLEPSQEPLLLEETEEMPTPENSATPSEQEPVLPESPPLQEEKQEEIIKKFSDSGMNNPPEIDLTEEGIILDENEETLGSVNLSQENLEKSPTLNLSSEPPIPTSEDSAVASDQKPIDKIENDEEFLKKDFLKLQPEPPQDKEPEKTSSESALEREPLQEEPEKAPSPAPEDSEAPSEKEPIDETKNDEDFLKKGFLKLQPDIFPEDKENGEPPPKEKKGGEDSPNTPE